METNQNNRTIAMLCHLSSLTTYVTGFGMILGPLIVWLIKKDESPVIDEHGKEALNFNITMFVAVIVSSFLILAVIGIVLLPIVVVCHIVLTIVAGLKANNGETYRYPFAVRLIK